MKHEWEENVMHTKFWLEDPKGRDHLEDVDIDGWKNNIRIVLREKGWEGVDWIPLAQDRDQWQALVNIVMNLSVHKR
jgi:hypothetical protein